MNLDQFYFDDSYIKDQIKELDLSSLTKGKNLRAMLLGVTGGLYNLNEQDKVSLGRVVEMVHNATLTHDDVIDTSHTRRGSPSIPALLNNKKSVLLGDYMLARALHELSDFNNPALTKELTLTLKELVEGEWIQYENTNPYAITTELYKTLALKKTGSLFRWCFIAPAIAARVEDEISLNLLSDFGEKLGVIFQMTDDIIDFNPESKKTYGLDFHNNNINFILHFIGRDHPELEEKFLSTNQLEDLNTSEMNKIENALARAKEVTNNYVLESREILKKLKGKLGDESAASLKEFESILDLITDRVF